MNTLRLALLSLSLLLLDLSIARAGVLVDHLDPANWDGNDPIISTYSPASVQINAVATFIGDGDRFSRISVLFGVQDDNGNPNVLSLDFRWSLTFYESYSEFASNPALVDDNLPQTRIVNQPSNADWMTVIGQLGPYQLRYAEFDLDSEGWNTTDGSLQGISVMPMPVGGSVLFPLSNGSNAIGLEEDWYILKSFGSNQQFGPGPLSTVLPDLSYPPDRIERYGAFRVETASAPDLIGDANGDCSVGAADYALWAAQFGQTGEGLSADFDGNGSVGSGDYALWAANFGKTCPPSATSVPEPAGMVLAGCGLAALWMAASSRRGGR